MKHLFSSTLILSLTIFFTGCQTPRSQYVRTAKERQDYVTAQAVGKRYAVATQGRYASQAAAQMYDRGGNIIDAVVAASFVISVERPQSSGIGGGGFMVFHEAKTGKNYAVDFRERAPLKATEKMYLDKEGKPNSQLSQDGILSVAVPGMVAGLIEIHERFGSLPLAEVVAPAIHLAENGFAIYEEFHRALEYRAPVIAQDPAARKIFLDANGKPFPVGTVLVQKDLAKTLRLIAQDGKKGFYQGPVAKAIVDISRKTGGILSQKDLDIYQVKWREPLRDHYAGYDVYAMPPPSSGGIHVVQFLNFLEGDRLRDAGIHSAKSIHLAAAALQSSFADRATYLGDPDFVEVPVQELLNEKYLLSRREEVSLNKARKAAEVRAGRMNENRESDETTHISIMDAEGNAVSTTQTINGWMGSGVVAPGTGVVLNNEMDDFSAKAGAQNLFGAVGGKPNAIAPRKTPLSSMSPTILIKNGKPVMAVGAPGGTRIISCVAQTILNYVEFKTSLYDAVSAMRYHHQWQPDVLTIEPPGPRPEVLKSLQEMGYDVKIQPVVCNVMAVAREGDDFRGVADPRDIGTSLAK